jgi:hypothetical protein
MPQHGRCAHLGPVRQVHLGAANGLEQAATSGLAVLPASCVTTRTERGQVMALNYITLVLDLADGTGTPARHRPGAAQPVGAAHRRHRRHDRHQGAAERETRRVVPAGAAARHRLRPV